MNSFYSSFSWNVLWPFKKKSTGRTYSKDNAEATYLAAIGPWESKMVTLQSILIWEKPGKSVTSILAFSALYWFLATSDVRIFYMVSMAALSFFLHHEWTTRIWPEIRIEQPYDQEDWISVHPNMLSAPEVISYLQNFIVYMKEKMHGLIQLRKRNPELFCIVMCMTFSFTWILGFYISGVVLFYSLALILSCAPGLVIHVIPKTYMQYLYQLFIFIVGSKEHPVKTSGSIESGLDEFLFDTNSEEAKNALEIPCTSHNSSERTLEEEDFLPKLDFPSLRMSSVPEVDSLYGDHSDEDLLDSDAVPPLASGSRKQPRELLQFDDSHFSDSEEEFEKGLSFNSHPPSVAKRELEELVQDAQRSIVSNIITSTMRTLGQNFEAAVPSVDPNIPVLSQSTSLTDEFELISEDEFQ